MKYREDEDFIQHNAFHHLWMNVEQWCKSSNHRTGEEPEHLLLVRIRQGFALPVNVAWGYGWHFRQAPYTKHQQVRILNPRCRTLLTVVTGSSEERLEALLGQVAPPFTEI